MIATAVIGSAVIGVAGTAIASSNAASAQKKSAQLASDTQKQMFDKAAGYESPYIQGGQDAYGTLNKLLGVGGNSSTMKNILENLPGYQFTLDQGLKSTQNAAAARGLGASGAALKGAANYATGLSNSNYSNYVNQLQNSSTIGANAANSLAGNAVQTGSNIGNNQIGAGNAQAAANNATGNAIANGGNSIGNYYTLNSLLKSTNATQSGDNYDMPAAWSSF